MNCLLHHPSSCYLHFPTVESFPQPLGYSHNSLRPIWVGINHILVSCVFISPVASTVLISSNPTNLVLSGAFSISFVTYTSSVALPFLTAALIVYLYLFMVLFRSVEYIPRNIELSGDGVGDVGIDRPSTALIDKSGAIFGSILLMATLGALTGTSTVGIPVWQVAVPAAAIMLWRDLWRDWRCHRAERIRTKEQAGEQTSVSPSAVTRIEIELRDLPLSASRSNSPSPVRHSRRQLALSTILSRWSHNLVQIFPTVHAIYRQLPLSLVPFAFLMFILVQGLASQGWVHVFACWWAVWVNKTGVVGAVCGMMIGSGLLCNVCHLVSCVVCNHHVTLDMWHKYRHDHSSSADATGMGVCEAARGLARPVCVCVRTCTRVELWGVHFGIFSVAGRPVVAGHAAKERHSCSAISIRKVEHGHIYGGEHGIWGGIDRTDVGST